MRFGTNRQNKTPYSHFTCSQYGQMGTQCSAHYIRYDTLYVYVLSRIQYWSHRAQMSEEKLLQQILKNGDRERITAAKRQESELKRAESARQKWTENSSECTRTGLPDASPNITSIC